MGNLIVRTTYKSVILESILENNGIIVIFESFLFRDTYQNI